METEVRTVVILGEAAENVTRMGAGRIDFGDIDNALILDLSSSYKYVFTWRTFI